MCFGHDRDAGAPRFFFDSQWDRFTLILHPGEFACYTVNAARPFTCRVILKAASEGEMALSCGSSPRRVPFGPGAERYDVLLDPPGEGPAAVRLAVLKGIAEVRRIEFTADEMP